MKRRGIDAGKAGMKIKEIVRVRTNHPIEQKTGMARRSARPVLVARPDTVEVDQVCTATGVRPAPAHAFDRRAGHIEDRQDGTAHRGRVEPVDDRLDGVDGTHLVAVDAARQRDAPARFRSPHDGDRHQPGLARGPSTPRK